MRRILGEVVAAMPNIMLYDGECDGYVERIVFADNKRPGIFYAVPLAIASEISKVKDNLAKDAAKKAYSRLAYVFEEVKASEEDGMMFCYRRCPELDKEPAADSAPPSL